MRGYAARTLAIPSPMRLPLSYAAQRHRAAGAQRDDRRRDRARRRGVQPLPRPHLEPAAHAGVERRPAQPGGDAQRLGQRRLQPARARGLPGDQVLRRHRARRGGPAAGLARAGRAAVLPHPRRRARERAGARRRAGGAAGARRRAHRRRAHAQSELGRGRGRQGRDGPLPRRDARQRAAVRPRALEGGRHPRRRAARRSRARCGSTCASWPTTPSASFRYSGIRLRVADGADMAALERRIDDDPRYALEAQPETDYYAKQAESANALYVLVIGIAVLAGIGAGFGAANTMYAAVQARTAEIGTLRALGFSRGSILWSFQVEAVALSGLGFALGAVLAVLLTRADRAAPRRHRLRRARPSPPTSSRYASRPSDLVAALVLALRHRPRRRLRPRLARRAPAADRGAAQGVETAVAEAPERGESRLRSAGPLPRPSTLNRCQRVPNRFTPSCVPLDVRRVRPD